MREWRLETGILFHVNYYYYWDTLIIALKLFWRAVVQSAKAICSYFNIGEWGRKLFAKRKSRGNYVCKYSLTNYSTSHIYSQKMFKLITPSTKSLHAPICSISERNKTAHNLCASDWYFQCKNYFPILGLIYQRL